MDIYEVVTRAYEAYDGEKRVIGQSAEGRKLFAWKIGKGEPCGISQYAMHGREWVCAHLALFHTQRGIARGSCWIVPLVNPDGALLSIKGLSSVGEGHRAMLASFNGGRDFSHWKANAEGVDLNVNFDARWGTGSGNCTFPSPHGYIGTSPCCAPESRALRDFTLAVRPSYTVSWHTKGEEIYWEFHQPLHRRLRDHALARVLWKSTGYPLRRTPHSAGGYKDWCIEKLKIPAFTIEVGKDEWEHPLNEARIEEIERACGDALAHLSEKILWK